MDEACIHSSPEGLLLRQLLNSLLLTLGARDEAFYDNTYFIQVVHYLSYLSDEKMTRAV